MMKTLKQLLEFAGVDTTKGKAKLLVENDTQQYCIYFDYTGAGRGPEPIAGPFNSEQECKNYAIENNIDLTSGSNYFMDIYRPEPDDSNIKLS